MTSPLRVLIVDDSEADAQLILRELRRGGYDPDFERVETAEEMHGALKQQDWEVILCDYAMPAFSAPKALELLTGTHLDIPFIVVSGKIGEQTAVEMMRSGAHDYVMKDNLTRLGAAVKRELAEAHVRRQRKEAEEKLRKTEEQFRQAQKMEAVGLLASGIAHDFRNQLTVIRGFAEILLRQSLVGDKGRDKVNHILKATDRSATLSRQLLAFSRKQLLSPRVVNLDDVIKDVTNPLGRILGENIKLSVVSAPDLGNVKVDVDQFQQALTNLVLNAKDAMPKGGRLAVEASNTELNGAPGESRLDPTPGPYVQVTVSDTGCGMDHETAERIFEPFFTTKPVGRGTGLGLAMVYGFVKQSGGHIDVQSQPGRGTTLSIYLPRVAEPAEPAEAQFEGKGIVAGTGTILVVEDDSDIRQIIAETLRESGYTVMDCANAQEALPLGRHYEGTIDLLMTDTIMPGMNGLELAEKIKEARPGIEVLYMSGYSDEVLAERGISHGQSNLLVKPFSARTITETVARLLSAGE